MPSGKEIDQDTGMPLTKTLWGKKYILAHKNLTEKTAFSNKYHNGKNFIYKQKKNNRYCVYIPKR